MFGLEAIAANNGWAISGLGISIVFTGLVFLSFAVAQLKNILEFWEKRGEFRQKFYELFQTKTDEKLTPDIKTSTNLEEAEFQMRLLTERLGEPFSLPKLVELSKHRGLSHPYSTINDLFQAKLIIPDGKGFFIWTTANKKYN